MTDRLGQQLGNYRLVSLLGQGGYAEVYLGQHVRLNQQAAIKVLHAHLTDQEAEHFQQEAQTIATLVHPCIVRVFDYDVQYGVPFLVIDYAPNGTLRRRYPKGSLVPLPVIVSSVKQVAAALQYAHEQKFIHRDVKPENMLLGRRQEVLLSDFGIATIAHSTSSLSTSAEGTSGTLAYMAPEQIEGHPRAASDQYALGIVVYEWLCGERPFEGSVSELIAQQLSMTPPPLRERVPAIPAEIEQVVLRALAKDPKARFPSVQDFATALEQASQHVIAPTGQLGSSQAALSSAAAPGYETAAVAPDQLVLPSETTPSADLPVGAFEPTIYPEASTPHGLDTPPSGAVAQTPQSGQVLAPTVAVVSPPLEPTMPVQQKGKRVSRTMAGLLIGLAIVIVAGVVLGSVSLLAHFGVIGAQSSAPTITPARGGTWTIGTTTQPDSLIPFSSGINTVDEDFDQALYLPLFYSDGFGAYHPGAASVVPTVQNGGISADAKTWTFHMRPGLVWSDGAPYDARDVAFSIKLFLTPQFNSGYAYFGYYFSSDDVSADHLSITIHLKRSFAPFLSTWMDGFQAPLAEHHFSLMAPGQILTSPDLLNPQVTSGPFMMAESAPGDHYTLVRNPRYYQASKGLPYLDKVVFSILSQDTLNQALQAGTIDSTAFGSLDPVHLQDYKRLHSYKLVTPPTSASFEALYFNFHNQVLASHLEVRQAIAMAIDNPALIDYENTLVPGIAIQQCTDHSAFYHPGFDPSAPCPIFNPAAANQLLSDHGWVKGPDGVRTKGGQRLEFEYSAPIAPNLVDFLALEAIIQRDLQAIGIKLDIQNYPVNIFFNTFLPGGNASPPTGAAADRYDIAEFINNWNWDPDDSSLLGCLPKYGPNFDFYCNPALDALYQRELATTDPGARQNLFEQIHLIYLTDFPVNFLFGVNDFYMLRKGAHNFQPSPLFITDENIAQWWCDGGKC
jgi:ABC-type transport system substrate-binding protein